MSKTLTQNDKRIVIRKFAAIALFCGASNTSSLTGKNVLLSAHFIELVGSPTFYVILEPNTANASFLIKTVSVIAAVPELGSNSLYLDPDVALADLGKVPGTITNGEYWEIRNPADIEAFLKKYAWLSKVFQKKPLFNRLLD